MIARATLVVTALGLLAAAARAEVRMWEGARSFPGRHYRLDTDVDETLAEDLVRMLDAHHAGLRSVFGRAPDHEGRLHVRLFRHRKDYRRLIGGDAGGMYTYRDRVANVWVQPRAYWTRHLLLHETTHQWMHLAFSGNRALLPWWLDEGFAEYCAFHSWDGETLRTGLSDVITLMDYVAKAKTITATPGYHVEKTLSGGLAGDRAEAWVLVHHLMNESAASRKRLLRCLGTVPRKVRVEDREKVERAGREVFRRTVTAKLDRLTAAVKAYAAGLTRSWRVVTIAWDRRGDLVLGNAATTGVLARVGEPLGKTAEVSFRYRVLEGKKGWVGLAHRIHDKDGFRVVTLTTPRSVLWNELAKRRWIRHGRAGRAVARDAGWHDVTVRFREKTVEITVDGEALPSLKRSAPEPLGTIGLFIDACRAEFRDFRLAER
jgi:hypothetical protein